MDDLLELLPPEAFRNLLFVSTETPADVEGTLRERGADPSAVGLLPVSGATTEYDGPLSVAEPVVPDDLTGLSIQFTAALDALTPGRGWVCFDSLNVFLLYATENRTQRFFDHAVTRARERNLCGVYGVVREAMDDRAYERLRRGFGAEIDRR